MSTAGSLGCPQCGAPLAPSTEICPYCRTALALVACPSCLARVFKGAKHCSRCGAETERAAEAGPTPARSCPHCRAPLAAVRVGAATLSECGRCGGLWTDAAQFERICAARDEEAVALGAALPQPSAARDARKGRAEPARYWPCPVCQQLMNRVQFARTSGVILDVCKAHGVWFDHDELRRIVEFIRSGGMDRARRAEKEEVEAELAELKRVRDREKGTYHVYIDDSSQSPRLDLGDLLSAARHVMDLLR